MKEVIASVLCHMILFTVIIIMTNYCSKQDKSVLPGVIDVNLVSLPIRQKTAIAKMSIISQHSEAISKSVKQEIIREKVIKSITNIPKIRKQHFIKEPAKSCENTQKFEALKSSSKNAQLKSLTNGANDMTSKVKNDKAGDGDDNDDIVSKDCGDQTHGSDGMTANDYFKMIRQRIELYKRFPHSAKLRQIQGRVTVYFLLAPDGQISGVEITKGSSHNILNQAAINTLKEASPFPKPPSNLFKWPIPVEITIVFELK